MAAAGDLDFQFDALQACRNAGPGQLNVGDLPGFASRDAVAAVMQREPCAGDGQRLSQGLGLTLDDRTALAVRIIEPFRHTRGRLLRRLRIGRGAIRPVEIPRCEMRDRYPPEGRAGFEASSQQCALRLADPQRCEHCGIIGGAIAVRIEVRLVVGDLQHSDHAAVVGRHPGGLVPIVISRRDRHAGRETEEVVDVDRNRSVESHGFGTGRQRLIGAQFHRVGVAATRRQRPRHTLRPVVADAVLGRADGQS